MLEPGAKKSQLQRRKGKKTLNGYDMESSINFNGKDGYDLQKRQQTLAHFVEPPPFTMKPNQGKINNTLIIALFYLLKHFTRTTSVSIFL